LPLADVKAEAMRLLQASSEDEIVLRLIGGVAIAIRCPSATRDGLRREYADLDFVGHERQSRAIKEFFAKAGYEPRARFNALMGAKRLIFNDLENERRADVFLDVFEMSHKFDFAARLGLEPQTLPLADLLATKLQIVEINAKDLGDVTAIFLDHDVGPSDGEMVNGPYIAKLCARDWGIYKTLTTNLAKLEASLGSYGLGPSESDAVRSKARRLGDLIEKEPKSIAWKLRARVGERVRWYEVPEPDPAS